MKLPKTYQASEYEPDIYKLWEESGAFMPSNKGEPFSIIMPPPNATGKLHVGHAEMLAIEDTLIRYRRMSGDSVLWVPGMDHAAIATNAVIEKQLSQEGKSKHDIGREAFLKRLADFVEDSKQTIRGQVKAMGSSTDWTKERYTMEPAMNRIVSEVFIKMYNDGLIYRGFRIVNWDSVLQTTVSDDELDYKDETTTLYTFKFGPFEISTTRPETKLGDKYVVMHPDDKRYKQYKQGDQFEADWINGKVTATVIKDDVMNMEFGTGVMTITPWHDMTDFEIAQRHKLEFEPIIDLDGKILEIGGEFKALSTQEARQKIVAKLNKLGLIVDQDDSYSHRIAISDRGKAVIEPQVMEQWFVDVNKPVVKWNHKKMSLKQVMQSVIKDGDIEIMPSRFDKTYFHWIDNLRDWCVSRQIWWGHQIPAWYKTDGEDKKQIHVGHTPPDDDGGWTQDPDTLDTWFSSALWSWSTLIEPETALNKNYDLNDMLAHSPLYKTYHPTSVLETGYDILFFWVARMILMTTYVTGDLPFKKVYLHGLVRAKDGSKMSKSVPELNIDPLDMIDKYGTDALRLSMIVGQAPGNDMRIYEEKIANYRNFCNKLWNIARFVEAQIGEKQPGSPTPSSSADHWILNRLHQTSQVVSQQLDDYQLGQAFDQLYHFIWGDFADWYLEVSKIEPNTSILAHVLEVSLKLAHPFIPFVTETIWDILDWEKGLLISSQWPKTKPSDTKKADEFEEIINIVKEIRNLRSEMNTHENTLYHKGANFLEVNAKLITALSGIRGVKQVSSGRGLHLTQTKQEAWIDIEDHKAIDYLSKITKKLDETKGSAKRIKDRLDNRNYVKSAPTELVNESRQQLAELEAILQRLEAEASALNHLLKGTD